MTSRAAVPVVSIEAENGATSSNVSTVNYEAASSAKAVKFRDVNQLSAKGFGMSVPRLPSCNKSRL
jgi:hypothetical protein